MNVASIWVLIRSAATSFISPSLVRFSRCLGRAKSTLGDDFFRRLRTCQSSIQNSIFCKATNVRLVARNWPMESRLGSGVVVFLYSRKKVVLVLASPLGICSFLVKRAFPFQ